MKNLIILAFVLIFPFVPFITDCFLHILTLIMLYMILALGLNVLVGFCGLLDLGYAGFYGIGAYTGALMLLNYNLPFWIALQLSGINGALWGIILGIPVLRLKGDYFAITTFGFAEIVVLIITNEIWLTRGPMGLPGIPPPFIFGFKFSGKIPFYYLTLAILLLVIGFMNRLSSSRIMRAFLAIREDEIAARACGINTTKFKVIAFALCAFIGSIGGCLFASWSSFISPGSFKFWESIFILCMIVLGGMGSVKGTIIGAGILVALSEVLRIVLPPYLVSARFLIFGIVLIIMMRKRPGGLFHA